MYSYKDGKSPLDFDEHFDKMTIRSIQAAGMLGVKWIIIHAGHYPHKPYNRSMSNQLKEANFAWFGQFFNEAQKWNVGIAIENMANVFAPKLEGIENEMYCSLHEDLLELVDGFKTDKVGICWDTGHANLQVRPAGLPGYRRRLKALHIADNNKLSDEHLAPYFGSIDWDGIMKHYQI